MPAACFGAAVTSRVHAPARSPRANAAPADQKVVDHRRHDDRHQQPTDVAGHGQGGQLIVAAPHDQCPDDHLDAGADR